ncbi:MAG: biopolymer transporter ExbD, partial [Sphingomonadaceae bacterium]|nr:biopolymer transporter ExbD [Sphingomonadaceae bacterium]
IIFMVTAPLLATGVQVDLPQSKAAALEQNQRPVAISIDRTGAIFVDDTPIPVEALGARLQQVAASSHEPGGPRIYLRADQGLDYGRVMMVMGEINRAGLHKVALVSTAQSERR